jgi:uncharacterized protein (TIGR02172 family)
MLFMTLLGKSEETQMPFIMESNKSFGRQLVKNELELLGRGRMADVYAWGDGLILKLNHAEFPKIVAEKEFEAAKAAHAAGVPVPAVFEVIERDGRFGITFERISGGSLLDELKSKPWSLGSCAKRLAELHARIHVCSLPVGLMSQKEYIRSGIEAAQGITDAERKSVLDYLQQLPEGDRLCHGDFHPDNILFSSRGPLIIDWMTGTRGDPAADVCRTLLIMETSFLPPTTPGYIRLLQSISRLWINTIYLKEYLRINQIDKSTIDRWRLPLLAARIREVEAYPNEKSLILAKMRTLMTG